jgi:pimeloyl-ACP methyl ester carboxylesterase
MGKLFKLFAFLFVLLAARVIYRLTIKNEDFTKLTELPNELTGNKNSNSLLVFLHGWPNKMSMWDNITKKLEADHLCLKISYPNFSDKLKTPGGIDYFTLADLIAKTVRKVKSENGESKKVTFVGHDWGSIFTFLTDKQHPELIDNIVAIDVGFRLSESIVLKLFNLFYQSTLALSNCIGGPIGDFMISSIMKMFSYLDETADVSKMDAAISSTQTYFYLELFKDIFRVQSDILLGKNIMIVKPS